MKPVGSVLRCPNCGATFSLSDDARTLGSALVTQRCPVCQYEVTIESVRRPMSVEDLGAGLSHLVSGARAGGISPEEIIQILRDELAFTAEMAHQGRQLCVQIIDLGPYDDQTAQPFDFDGREVLSSRGRLTASVS